MNNNQTFFDDILDEELCEFDVDDFKEIDDRYWKSYVEDIEGGDNFIDYCEYIFGILEEDGYYD